MTLQSELLDKLKTYPEAVQQEVGKLTQKMIVLGFPAFFEKLETGPVLNTYYFKPTAGALFSKILSKEEELAGTLSVESVRIERQMGSISIAVPRSDRQLIRFDSCLHEMLSSPATSEMALPLMMGQSPSGKYLYADLADQPHLLIAGATGSGKSIYTAQLISSLALFRSPRELSFKLVDTKNLDLVLFEGLAHVTDIIRKVEDLRSVLNILLKKVRTRTEMMSGMVRNVREWNASGIGQSFNYEVLIIDEYADVVDTDNAMWAGVPAKDRPTSIPTLIKTIAQISRAAGIHIIIATQRPSVKILSGDIKTNFPARTCFKLPTMADSRVVLDENGAENLLGKGDYLYKIAGSDTTKRAHTAYVTTADIARIIEQHEQIRDMYSKMREVGV